MRVSIGVGEATRSDDGFGEVADFVVEAERLGVDIAWSAEAWGSDAVVPLAYLAARTERIRLASGVMQVDARTPAMTAMTALTLAAVSNDRFILGLGTSGPQVVEGLHGCSFNRPLERLSETISAIRMAFAGEPLEVDGSQVVLPRPGGEGKALRLAQQPRPNLPIHLAALGPKALELTGAIADGWIGTSFVPERSAYYLDHLRAGAISAGRDPEGLAIDVGGPVAFADDIERLMLGRKKALAFQLSAMGSATTNYYNSAYARIGFADAAERVRSIWLGGDRAAAATAVPDDLALGTSLFGTPSEVSARIQAYADAGVTSLRLTPMGRDTKERLDTLGQAVDLVRTVNAR